MVWASPTARTLFETRSSPIQGKGGFALQPIRRGTRFVEYTGERISHEVADKRYDDDNMDRHHTFLFTINNKVCVDAAVGGNDSRFINHSCDPNCEVIITKGRIFIETLRDISVGEELFYDYSYERDEGDGPEADKQYLCKCGTKKCRGTILVPETKKKKKKKKKKKTGKKKKK